VKRRFNRHLQSNVISVMPLGVLLQGSFFGFPAEVILPTSAQVLLDRFAPPGALRE
jgi:hypothetical protein